MDYKAIQKAIRFDLLESKGSHNNPGYYENLTTGEVFSIDEVREIWRPRIELIIKDGVIENLESLTFFVPTQALVLDIDHSYIEDGREHCMALPVKIKRQTF